MGIVGGWEAPPGHIAPSAHPQSLNTPTIGSSRKPSFDAGPPDLSRLQRSKSSPLHKLVHLSLRYNPCSVWFLSRPPGNGRWNGLFAWDEGCGGKHAGKIEADG